MAWNTLFGGGRAVAPVDEDIIGSPAPDALGLGRFRDWRTGEIGGRLRFANKGEGLLIIGRNGSGKDTRLLINQLLQSSGCSNWVLDPKGELCAVCAPHLRTHSTVHVINPYGVLVEGDTFMPGYEDLESIGFNPMTQRDPRSKSFVSDCAYDAAAIIVPDKSGSGNAKHFINSAKALITLCWMWEIITADREKRIPTMTNVRAMICTASGYDYTLKQEYGWPVLARGIITDALKSKDIAEPVARRVANLARQFTVWNNEISGILSEAMQQTEAFDVTEIAEDMAKPGFDMREIKQRPTTVFVIMPPLEMENQSSYLRLLVDTSLRAVMRPRKPGEPNCNFILNEFATLGRLETLRRVWGYVRGNGVTLIPVLQSLNQLQETYGRDNAATFLGQAGIVASFGAADQETAEWLSKRCGDTTAVLAGYNAGTQQNGHGMGSSSGLNWSQVKVPAVTAHEMFDLTDGSMVQFAAGMGDFISAYAPPYWMIDECAARARTNPYYQPRGA